MKCRWLPRAKDPPTQQLTSQLGLRPVIARLLANRGITSASQAELFLRPRLASLRDPFLLPGMFSACEHICAAASQRKKITLFGDYDVDGVTSLTLLATFLKHLGTEPSCFIPHRIEHGYGLSPAAAQDCFNSHHPDLLIALDCGTTSTAAIGWLKSRGVDCVVVDHHEPQPSLPAAAAIVNPKLDPAGGHDPYCTVGLVFKLCHALLKHTGRRDIDLRQLLDLVAVGTVADIVPLRGENRIFTKHGLRQLEKTQFAGLRALMEVSGVKKAPTTTDLGYRIGPRINAAGRLDDAKIALELLLADDEAVAAKSAALLDAHNRERQQIEENMVKEALEDVLSSWSEDDTHAIVVARHDWHPGVVGIVASRLQRRFWRPTFVIAIGESGLGKGSGRSVDGVHLVEALQTAAALLENFGGHEMAAGVTLREERLDALRECLNSFSAARLIGENRLPAIRYDAEISPDALELDFYNDVQALEPYGQANPEPVFLLRQLTPSREPRLVGRGHCRLTLERDGKQFDAIAFGTTPEQLPSPPWDVLGSLQLNDYFDEPRVEMRILDLRHAA